MERHGNNLASGADFPINAAAILRQNPAVSLRVANETRQIGPGAADRMLNRALRATSSTRGVETISSQPLLPFFGRGAEP